ncbi:type III pantothenate kinase [Mesomycoplasma molare]|uniref:Type III pantothenate kinase n=1 Tax=Mesomycoplasma molare TaxID=171288 RepID=A0ABY5TVQ7_9BACT|nr:type III pantothenate kinase [Mesomycoplasma molare]UWD34409.1 type III pantothenate kinase [Mesomycoplasma molare]
MLFLDLGNSLLKIGYYNKNKKLLIKKIKSHNLNKEKIINEILNENIQFKKALLSSVKPKLNKLIIESLNEIGIKTTIIKNDFIINNYSLKLNSSIDISKVGSDILLNALFVSEKFKSGIIVSLGTATVISKIQNNILEGVIIMPGIETNLISLFSSASKIKKISLNYDKTLKLGTNTKDAISIGILKGHYYSIKSLIKENNEENLPIFYTGGNIKYLKSFIKEKMINEMVIKSLILTNYKGE